MSAPQVNGDLPNASHTSAFVQVGPTIKNSQSRYGCGYLTAMQRLTNTPL